MRISISGKPVYSYFKDPMNPAVRGAIMEIDDELRIKVPNAHFAKNHESKKHVKCPRCKAPQLYGRKGICKACGEKLIPAAGSWDGYHHSISSGGRFLSGILPLVSKAAEQRIGADLDVFLPEPIVSLPPKPGMNGVELRGYQLDALNAALRRRRGILELATNSGKTEVAAAFINSVKELGQCLWLTHSLSLADQTKKRIEGRIGIPTSFAIHGDICTDGALVVASVQTLSKQIKDPKIAKWLSTIKAVVLDECHLGSADSWASIMMHCSSAWYRIGLSGTPFTDDPVRNRKLIGMTGPSLAVVSNQELIDNGYSAEPIVITIPFHHNEYLDYNAAMQYGISQNTPRNAKLASVIKKTEKEEIGLVLVSRIAHGKRLVEALDNVGVPSTFLSGKDSIEVRNKCLERAKAGKLNAIVATSIFDLGIDVAELGYVALAVPTKSTVRILQRVGRVLRRSETKTSARVYLFADTGDRFLEPAAKRMVRVLIAEGFEVI